MHYIEYEYLLIKAVEKLNTININTYQNNELLIPIQRELKYFNFKDNTPSNSSFNESVIIFRYKKIVKENFICWELAGNNINNTATACR